MHTKLCAVLFGTLTLAATVARADGWPSTAVGNWNVIANQTSGVLHITSQAASGNCRFITGTANFGTEVTNTLEGFYCPFSGRIHFVRKNASNNDTFQSYSGNLSQPGTYWRMAGSFTAVNAHGGSPGEYSFNASRLYP